MNSRSVAIFAIVVAVVVGVSLYFLGGENAAHYTPPTPPPVKVVANEPESIDSTKRVTSPPVFSGDTRPVLTTPPEPAVAMTEDDRKIDDVLKLYPGNSDQDHANTTQALINLLPSLTKDGQVEASQHISNLLTDENWGKINHIWRNPAFNPDVIEVFSNDLLNREDKVKLPALLEAIRIPNHHAREDALSTMQVFLDEDYGDDVGKWETAMKAYLKKADDEEKEANAVTPGAPR